MQIERVPIASLRQDPNNARKHSSKNLDAIKRSLETFGQQKPIVVGSDGIVIAGNGTLEGFEALGWDDIEIVRSHLIGADATAYAIADNRTAELAEWDKDVLSETLEELEAAGYDLEDVGFEEGDLPKLEDEEDKGKNAGNGSLQARFGVAPFSVLNAREGWWQDRKRAWLSIGIESEMGRGDNLLKFSETAMLKKKKPGGETGFARSFNKGIDEKNYGREEMTGTSIFDPVLCELAYRWFCPQGGLVLDPFAGGSVRGILIIAESNSISAHLEGSFLKKSTYRRFYRKTLG